MTEKDIERINVLYRKRKAGTITDEELAEHDRLRKEYIEAFRNNLRSTLNNTVIDYPDGTSVDLGVKYGGLKRDEKGELPNA